MVTLHCRRDHLSPSFHEASSSSCYQSSYSPNKHINYNQPEIEKGLQHFRKYQNSTSKLPSIPKVLEHSAYQKAYYGHSLERQPKGKEKPTHFIKMNWALDPSSNYQVSSLIFRRTT
jgi:hypothetical protein